MIELLRLVRLMRPHWPWVLLGVVLSLFTVLANVGLLALSSWFIASMAIAGAAHTTMDFTLPSGGVRGLALGRTGGRYLERIVNHNTTFRILARLRVWFFERLEPLAPARLSRYRSGDLLSRIRSDIDTLDDFYVRALVPLAVAFLAVAAIALFLAGYSFLLMVIDLLALVAGGALLPLLLLWLGARPGRERVVTASELRSAVVDGVQGSGELIALGALAAHTEKLERLSVELTAKERLLRSLEGGADGGIILTSGLAMWAGALLLVPMVAGGLLAPQDIAMLSVLMLASFEAVMPLPGVFRRLGEMAAAARRLFEIIDAEPAVIDPPGREAAASAGLAARSAGSAAGRGRETTSPSSGRRSEPQAGTRRPVPSPPASGRQPKARGLELSVSGLKFSYDGGEPWIIDGLSFAVGAGGRIAVVGPTGAGKSSLVNVLLRFWDYTEGSIRVGGKELKELSGDEARQLFSVAEQIPFLFHTSIRENLLIAAPSAGDDGLVEVLEKVELGGLLATTSSGLGTLVGEGGLKLSAGQARRLSVARALLKPSPFLILDEPTEGLDDFTADTLLEVVQNSTSGRTVILISHRRRDLRFADSVVRMQVRR